MSVSKVASNSSGGVPGIGHLPTVAKGSFLAFYLAALRRKRRQGSQKHGATSKKLALLHRRRSKRSGRGATCGARRIQQRVRAPETKVAGDNLSLCDGGHPQTHRTAGPSAASYDCPCADFARGPIRRHSIPQRYCSGSPATVQRRAPSTACSGAHPDCGVAPRDANQFPMLCREARSLILSSADEA